MTDGIYFDQATGHWFWEIGELWRTGFKTEMEAVKDYVTQLLDQAPDLKAEVSGKTWSQIRLMVVGRP